MSPDVALINSFFIDRRPDVGTDARRTYFEVLTAGSDFSVPRAVTTSDSLVTVSVFCPTSTDPVSIRISLGSVSPCLLSVSGTVSVLTLLVFLRGSFGLSLLGSGAEGAVDTDAGFA